MEDKNNILIVWMPNDQIGDERVYRDYVLESPRTGVLVLPSEVSCEVMELPPLGGVAVREVSPAAGAGIPQMEKAEPETVDVYLRGGRGAVEKRAIQKRLQAYREAHGLGCWEAVVKASGGALSADQLRDMHNGTASLPIADWRRANRALDKLTGRPLEPAAHSK